MAIGWGKPSVYIKNLSDESAKWIEIPTPVENSTQLTPTKGDKKEAKIEGGSNEDVKFGKNNYEFAYQIRVADNKTMPISHNEGLVEDEYAVALVPENPKVPGFIIDRTRVSVEDPWSSEEGGAWTYTHDALEPETGKKVKWGVITVTGSKDNYTITGSGEDFSTGK